MIRVRVSLPAVDFVKFFNSYQVDPAKLRRIEKKAHELGLATAGYEYK